MMARASVASLRFIHIAPERAIHIAGIRSWSFSSSSDLFFARSSSFVARAVPTGRVSSDYYDGIGGAFRGEPESD